jgi:hypothetical protein
MCIPRCFREPLRKVLEQSPYSPGSRPKALCPLSKAAVNTALCFLFYAGGCSNLCLRVKVFLNAFTPSLFVVLSGFKMMQHLSEMNPVFLP